MHEERGEEGQGLMVATAVKMKGRRMGVGFSYWRGSGNNWTQTHGH